MIDSTLRRYIIGIVNDINLANGSNIQFKQTKLYIQKFQLIPRDDPQAHYYGSLWIHQRKNKSFEIILTGKGIIADMEPHLISYFQAEALNTRGKLSWFTPNFTDVHHVINYLAGLSK